MRALYRYNRSVRDEEFVQRVRRHTPSSMIPLVARYGAAFADEKAYRNANRFNFVVVACGYYGPAVVGYEFNCGTPQLNMSVSRARCALDNLPSWCGMRRSPPPYRPVMV